MSSHHGLLDFIEAQQTQTLDQVGPDSKSIPFADPFREMHIQNTIHRVTIRTEQTRNRRNYITHKKEETNQKLTYP